MMERKSEVAIIGSGVTGLSTAYSLLKKGLRDIIILETGHLSSGASTRNGGGIRAQFTTEENIILAKWSIERFRRLGQELNTNFWFRQGGYLFLAESEQELAGLKRAAEFQARFDLGTRVLDISGINDIVPCLDTSKFIGGSFRKGDGVLFPFPILFGYAEHLRASGVRIETHCEVRTIRKTGGGFELETSRGRVQASKVLNAAGGWSSSVSSMLGVRIPTRPVRHQIMSSEPLAPFLDPMVVTLRDGLYMCQGPRGELTGGITEPEEGTRDSRRSGFDFCRLISERIVGLCPRMSGVRMLRQWAGFYDMSPDANPILDEMPGAEGAFVSCGFSGHGFMISPAVGEFMACMLLGQKPPFPNEPYSLSRFERGSVRKEALVIG
jgi:sarcosine oxidase subunit beta